MVDALLLDYTKGTPSPLIDLPQGWLWLGFIALFGACIGSFANAAAMRIVRDEDPISQPSRCRSCQRKLKWFENLPIIGYLLVRGRCGTCHDQIPMRYIMAEIAAAAIFVIYAALLPVFTFFAFIIAIPIALIAFLTDRSDMVLWTPSLGFGIAAGLLPPLIVPGWPLSVQAAIIGAITGGALIAGTNLIFQIIRGKQGFGTGDIWLLAMIGSWCGAIGATMIFFASAYLGAIIGVALILRKKGQGSSKLPFGVFLSIVFLLYPISYILLN